MGQSLSNVLSLIVRHSMRSLDPMIVCSDLRRHRNPRCTCRHRMYPFFCIATADQTDGHLRLSPAALVTFFGHCTNTSGMVLITRAVAH